MNFNPIIIVGGEPQSIFLEILFKKIKKIKINKLSNPIVLITSKDVINKNIKKFKVDYDLNYTNKYLNNLVKDKINLIDIPYKNFSFSKKISSKSNFFLHKSFLVALNILKKKKCSGLISGPISKKTFLKGKYYGITEFLASHTNSKDPVMLIFNKSLSVSPLTTHIPISNVANKVKKTDIVKKILIIKNFYKNFFNKVPKIALTGLNPHCESFGKINTERDEIIPAIKLLKKKKCFVKGPYPADTIFLKENISKFDVIFGMYHDQVLTPMKSIFGFNAINITLGLPFLRITPDHGPNEKMVGKNQSNPESLIDAIKFFENYAK